jgi:hypothetical protein
MLYWSHPPKSASQVISSALFLGCGSIVIVLEHCMAMRAATLTGYSENLGRFKFNGFYLLTDIFPLQCGRHVIRTAICYVSN